MGKSLHLIPLWKECAPDFYLENVDTHKPLRCGSKFKDRSQIHKALDGRELLSRSSLSDFRVPNTTILL